jgi:hypothetical protein
VLTEDDIEADGESNELSAIGRLRGGATEATLACQTGQFESLTKFSLSVGLGMSGPMNFVAWRSVLESTT